MSVKLNKIGIIGTQCIGKSTLVEDMMLQWPQLSKPEKTYRDLIKEKNLPINKDGTKESQGLIIDFLVEEASKNYGKRKMELEELQEHLEHLVFLDHLVLLRLEKRGY